jgi:hypothetical protein
VSRPVAIPPDPELPGLAELLPPEGAPPAVAAFAATLCRGVDATATRALYVRYRPTRSCVALWSLGRAPGPQIRVWAKQVAGARALEAAVERTGGLAARLEAARGLAPWRVLPEQRLLLHAFGLTRLPALVETHDAAWAGAVLAPRLGLAAGATLEETRALSYKPERRCVLHYRWSSASGGVAHFAKLFRDERGQELFSRQRAIAAQLRVPDKAWEVVAPLAYLPDTRLLVFPAVEGEKATRILESVADRREPPSRITAAMARAAQGLGALQRCRLDGLPDDPPEALLLRFASDAQGVARVAPELAGAVRSRIERLDAARSELAPEPLVPSHGAFRHGQLLLRGESTVVLDFDTLARSGASADAGNFLAYLDLTGLRRPRLRPVLEACRGAFAAGLPEPRSPWLHWFQALSLIKVTLRSFLSLDPAWPRLAPALLRIADEVLGRLPASAGRAAAC